MDITIQAAVENIRRAVAEQCGTDRFTVTMTGKASLDKCLRAEHGWRVVLHHNAFQVTNGIGCVAVNGESPSEAYQKALDTLPGLLKAALEERAAWEAFQKSREAQCSESR